MHPWPNSPAMTFPFEPNGRWTPPTAVSSKTHTEEMSPRMATPPILWTTTMIRLCPLPIPTARSPPHPPTIRDRRPPLLRTLSRHLTLIGGKAANRSSAPSIVPSGISVNGAQVISENARPVRSMSARIVCKRIHPANVATARKTICARTA